MKSIPGVNLRSFSAEKIVILTRITAIQAEKNDPDIGFQEKRQFFAGKNTQEYMFVQKSNRKVAPEACLLLSFSSFPKISKIVTLQNDVILLCGSPNDIIFQFTQMTSSHFSTLCGHHFFRPFENLKVTSLTALPFYIYFAKIAIINEKWPKFSMAASTPEVSGDPAVSGCSRQTRQRCPTACPSRTWPTSVS
jgi:hypothetical protein